MTIMTTIELCIPINCTSSHWAVQTCDHTSNHQDVNIGNYGSYHGDMYTHAFTSHHGQSKPVTIPTAIKLYISGFTPVTMDGAHS